MLTFAHLTDYIALTRLNRPIGTYLLLWPTLWALWIAAQGIPNVWTLCVFTLGVVLMRSAGCIINDYADRNIDRHVKRTRDRPLTAGRISSREALTLFVILCLISFCLVLTLNLLTIALSFIALLLAAVYPFMKRYTHFPQVVLGAAFSWAIPMAFAAELGTIPAIGWLLFLITVIWTVAYDTLYAMVDREDDLKIGVKSTAIFFGRFDKITVAFLQVIVIAGLVTIGILAQLEWIYFVALSIAALSFIYQQWLIYHRQPERCFQAFLNNHWTGLIIFLGIALTYFFK